MDLNIVECLFKVHQTFYNFKFDYPTIENLEWIDYFLCIKFNE